MAEGSSSGWSEFGKVSLEELLGEDWHYFVPEEPVGPFPAIKLPIPKLFKPETGCSVTRESNTIAGDEEKQLIDKFIAKNANGNTSKSTRTWINVFEKWRITREIQQPLEEIPESELDSVLQRFYAQVKKANGQDYEPDSLRTMLASLDRYLRETGKSYSILSDKKFQTSRQVLNGKAIELREQGKGKKPRKADALSKEEEEMLWNKGVLGISTPKNLNFTVFYLLSQHFGTRGRQEHHQIRLEELKWVQDSDGKTEYVEWVEGITKTRKGGLQKPDRRLKQRVFATGDARCPVAALEALVSHRPKELRARGPLYLQPSQHPEEEQWFTKMPLGVNSINKFMKKIAEEGGLDTRNKNFTNHSVRKTVVMKLKKAGVASRDITAITGHKNEESLKSYEENSLTDHKHLSNIIAGKKPNAHQEVSCPSYICEKQYISGPQNSSAYVHPPRVHEQHPASRTGVLQPSYNIMNNCTVYVGPNVAERCSMEPPQQKRRKAMIIYSSDEEA